MQGEAPDSEQTEPGATSRPCGGSRMAGGEIERKSPAGRVWPGRVVCPHPSARTKGHSTRAMDPPRGNPVMVFLTLAQLRRFGALWVRCYLDKRPAFIPKGEAKVLPFWPGYPEGQESEA